MARPPSRLLCLALALAAPCLAGFMLWVLWSFVRPNIWFMFYPAVLLSGWLGGFLGGLVSTVISIGVTYWFFIEPIHAFKPIQTAWLISSALFLVTGAVISILLHRFRQNEKKLEHSFEQIRQLNISLEAKVAARTAELTIASQAKSTFLAHMSHEIRTPLNGILGLTQILARSNLTPEHHELIREIGESGESLRHIINDILDFSKIEAGQLRMDSHPFALAPVIARIEHLLQPSASAKHVSLQIQGIPHDQGSLLGDSLRLEQILINLVGNAIKFTEYGRVTLAAIPREITDAVVRWRFEVKDTGLGITPEHLANLFQPFNQGDASITRRYGGTGLGLAISRRLVDLMGGDMGASSEVGKGSTFWFEIPFQKSDIASGHSQVEAAENGPPLRTPLAGLRVLAVDDSRINLLLIQRALQQEGATVSLAADGQQCLQILRASPRGFDVVLMDVQMPVMDGLTATQTMRNDPVLATIPVIAVTAGVLPEEREAAIKAGVNGFLAKPLDLKEMSSCLSIYADKETGHN